MHGAQRPVPALQDQKIIGAMTRTDLGTLLPTLPLYDTSMVVQSEPQRYAFSLSRSQDGEGFVYCTLERMLGASRERSGSHISRPVPISIPFRPIALLRSKRPRRLRGGPSAYRFPKNLAAAAVSAPSG